MPADRFYIPGTFWRICDRTGFKVRSYNTRKEWTGRIVRDRSWEYRHPQDFVTGVRDDQTVPDPRPRPVDVFGGVLTTTFIRLSGAGATAAFVLSAARMMIGDRVSIILDSGVSFLTTLTNVTPSYTVTGAFQLSAFQNSAFQTTFTSDVIYFANPLPFSAGNGNLVTDMSATTVVKL